MCYCIHFWTNTLGKSIKALILPGIDWFGLVLWHINHCRLFNAKSIFIDINSSISNNSVLAYKNSSISNYSVLHMYTVSMSKNSSIQNNSVLHTNTVLFQAIQFSISTQFSSIWPINRTLSGATTLGQSQPGSDGNERVLSIPQSSSITGTLPSDCLVSYLGHSLGVGSYPSAEKQSVYSTTPADWAIPAIELIAPLLFFYKDSFNIKCSMKDDMPLNKEMKVNFWLGDLFSHSPYRQVYIPDEAVCTKTLGKTVHLTILSLVMGK